MKARKILAMVAALALTAALAVGGTLAYLTSQATVTNTFSVGAVAITMDEAKVDTAGVPVTGAARTDKNQYKLMPGHEYTKDPVIHVVDGSEDSWIFVTVDNQISEIEAKDTEKMADGNLYVPIATQITTTNGWTQIDGTNVYYKEYKAGESLDFPVFGKFMISGSVDPDTLKNYAPVTTGEGADAVTTYKSIVINGYAVQKDGFTSASAAWTATFGAPSTQG